MKCRATQDRSSGKPKVLHLLMTDHKPLQVNANKSYRAGNIIQNPSCTAEYNYNMGGVDMVDQQLDSIEVLRKSYKWHKKLFLRLLMHCLLAFHKLYSKRGGKDEFLIYTLDLCTLLLQKSPGLENPLEIPPIDNIIQLTGRNHWPGKEEAPDWKKTKSKTKRCRVCAAKGIKTQSGNVINTGCICMGCLEEPGLCVDKDCFEIFHTKFDIS